MTKPLLLFSQGDVYNSLLIAEHLVPVFEKDYNIIFITPESETVAEKCKSHKIILHQISQSEYDEIETQMELFEKLSQIEGELGYPIQKILFADPEFYKFYRKNKLKSLKIFIKMYNAYKEIIEKNDIRIHLTFGEDRIYTLIPHFLLKKRNGESYLLRIVPYYGLIFTTDFFGTFNKKILITEKFNINYEKYLNSMLNSSVYFSSDIINKINFNKYRNTSVLFKRLREISTLNRENKKTFYYKRTNLSLIKIALAKPCKYFEKIKIFFLDLLLYDTLKPDKKYIYYPLHYTDDAQIRLKFPEEYNQYEFIRNIAKNLPINFSLLVKEHPAFVGNYSLTELYNLSKHPNIIVLNPRVSSKQIFNLINYVITINSTVGYEALFFKKLVLRLGNAFYNDFPGVININGISNLYNILQNEQLLTYQRIILEENLEEKTMDLLQRSMEFDYQNFYKEGNMEKFLTLFKYYTNAITDDEEHLRKRF